MNSSMQVAINWPTMFGLDGLSLAPVFRPVVTAIQANQTTTAPSAWVRPAKNSETSAKASSTRAASLSAKVLRKRLMVFSSAAGASSTLPTDLKDSVPIYCGPLITKVGTVVFGNVTKRLYHRYWCTTRNW